MISYSVRWYFRGLFPHPLTEIVLAIIIGSQYYAQKFGGGELGFITASQLLLLPLYGLIMSFHVVRDPRLTVFEISVLKSWSKIAVAKIITLIIGFFPLLLVDAVFIAYFFNDFLILFLVIWAFEYIAMTCVASLVRTQSGAFLIVISFGILFPVGVLSILSYSFSTHLVLNASVSIVVYALAPMLAYYYSTEGLLSLNSTFGFFWVLLISLILVASYYWMFVRSELDV